MLRLNVEWSRLEVAGRAPPARAPGRGRKGERVNPMRIDCTGMRCPQPVLKLAVETAETPAGTVVEIVGDCPTFEKDIRTFCDRRKKTLLSVRGDGVKTVIQIQY
jgi:tRNA 2-thiouridine synthesizing protein A